MSAFRQVLDRVSNLPVLRDARIFQVTFQGMLLTTGLIVRRFQISLTQVALVFATVVLTQLLFVRLYKLKNIGVVSALITGMGLCLFLRAENLWIHPLAAFVSVASKFLIRVRGKHIFNPSNFGAILALGLLPGAFMAPGQWGWDFLMAAWCIALGATVVVRAQRNDIAWAFLFFYLGALAIRVISHDQSWLVWWRQVNGTLLIFTFFMISDPMTTPNHWRGRVLFAAAVAILAYFLQFVFYQFNAAIWHRMGGAFTTSSMAMQYHAYGMLFALFVLSPLVPLFDRFWPAEKYRWGASPRLA